MTAPNTCAFCAHPITTIRITTQDGTVIYSPRCQCGAPGTIAARDARERGEHVKRPADEERSNARGLA